MHFFHLKYSEYQPLTSYYPRRCGLYMLRTVQILVIEAFIFITRDNITLIFLMVFKMIIFVWINIRKRILSKFSGFYRGVADCTEICEIQMIKIWDFFLKNGLHCNIESVIYIIIYPYEFQKSLSWQFHK